MNVIASVTIWLTGLPCSGKTTLATALQGALLKSTVVLDGDELRKTLCADLGYSPADRFENTRRVGCICRILNAQGVNVVVALVSPYRMSRALARALVGARFLEVYMACPQDVCATRDTKGMYKMALSGAIKGFTGVTDVYESPISPELVIDSSKMNIQEEVVTVLQYLSLAGEAS
jgi:adenylylsulfate kinase